MVSTHKDIEDGEEVLDHHKDGYPIGNVEDVLERSGELVRLVIRIEGIEVVVEA